MTNGTRTPPLHEVYLLMNPDRETNAVQRRQIPERMMQMKKYLSILLVLMMLAALCGCAAMEKLQGVELPAPPEIEETAEPTEPEEAAQEESAPAMEETVVLPEAPAARVIVKVTKTAEEHYDPAEGKQLILDFSYETPFVDISNRDSAANAINEYIAMLDETYCTGNDYGDGSGNGLNMLLELATDNFTYAYETGSDVNLEMSSNRSVSVERADDAVLSLLYCTYTYTGGVHGDYMNRAYVFDTEDGSLVEFDMLAADSSALRQGVLEAMKQYASDHPELSSADISEETLTELLDGAWFFSDDGLSIIADRERPQDIVVIGYSELSGLVDEKWMPASYEGDGELSVIYQSDFADGSMEVIDKVVADENGEELCLIVSGLVRNVRISKVSYTDYTGTFYETEQLWNCSDMKDCAVQIQTDIPDGMPRLMISYCTADGQEIYRLLTQSGEDGSLILAENVAAVG